MTSVAGFWVCLGLIALGLCIDSGLTNVANAIKEKTDG